MTKTETRIVRFEIHQSQFTEVDQLKAQYYIWDNHYKAIVARIYRGGISMARIICKCYETYGILRRK